MKQVPINELLAMRPVQIDIGRIARESPGMWLLMGDLLVNGQKEPIVIQDGKIVDGIHRLFAWWLLGYEGEVTVEEKQ